MLSDSYWGATEWTVQFDPRPSQGNPRSAFFSHPLLEWEMELLVQARVGRSQPLAWTTWANAAAPWLLVARASFMHSGGKDKIIWHRIKTRVSRDSTARDCWCCWGGDPGTWPCDSTKGKSLERPLQLTMHII